MSAYDLHNIAYSVDSASGKIAPKGPVEGAQKPIDHTIQDLVAKCRENKEASQLAQLSSKNIMHIISFANELSKTISEGLVVSPHRPHIQEVLATLHTMRQAAVKREAALQHQQVLDQLAAEKTPLASTKEMTSDIETMIGLSIKIDSEASLNDLNNVLTARPNLIQTILKNEDEKVNEILRAVKGDVSKLQGPLLDAIQASRLTIKHLDLSGLKLSSERVERLVLMFPELETLRLPNCHLSNSALEKIGTLTKLTELDLSNNEAISSVGLKEIAKIAGLRILNLSSCQHVTNETLKSFQPKEGFPGLSQLERLDLKGCNQVNNDGVGSLTGMNHLTHLDLSSAALTDHGIRKLQSLPKLETVSIKVGPGITKSALEILRLLPNIKKIEFIVKDGRSCEYSCKDGELTSVDFKNFTKLSANELADIFTIVKAFPFLRNSFLNLCVEAKILLTEVLNPDFRMNTRSQLVQDLFLAIGKEVKEITLYNSITLDHLERVRTICPNLEKLDFSITFPVNDAILTELAKFKKLTNLSIDKGEVTAAGLQELSKLTHLKALALASCGIDTAGVQFFQNMRELEHLDLRRNAFSGEAIKYLPRQLKTVNISGAISITDEGIEHLRSMRELNSLVIGEIVTPRLMQALSTLQNLRILSLETNIIDEDLEGLRDCTNINELTLYGGYSSKAFQIIATTAVRKLTLYAFNDQELQFMPDMPRIEGLILPYGDDISDVGLQYLPENLKELDISETKVSDKGLEQLKSKVKLTALTIGLQATSEGLKSLITFPNLRTLRVKRDGFHDLPANFTDNLKALKNCTNLETLDLGDCAQSFISLAWGVADADPKKLIKEIITTTKIKNLVLPSYMGFGDQADQLRKDLPNVTISFSN